MCDLASEWEMKLRGGKSRNVFRLSYLVDRLLALFVLLSLLLHLFPLFDVVDECEEVTQVNDERLSLGEKGKEGGDN